GHLRRPHLTLNDELLGTGSFVQTPTVEDEYRRGYLCGMVRGDGHLGRYESSTRGRREVMHRLRLALTDAEALGRSRQYLELAGVATTDYVFQPATDARRGMRAIRTQSAARVSAVESLIAGPDIRSFAWRRGFLAGIFDAEGSYSRGVLRISNKEE